MNIRLVEFGFLKNGVYDYKTNISLLCTSLFPDKVDSLSTYGDNNEITLIMPTPKTLSWDDNGGLWINLIRPNTVLTLILVGGELVRLEHPLDEAIELYGQPITLGGR